MSKEHDDWNFKLRVIGTTPDTIPLERLGEYMKEFAKLLGTSSRPTFAGMKNESASTLARVQYPDRALLRIAQSKAEPTSNPGRALERIQGLIDSDKFPGAELRDRADNVIYLFKSSSMETPAIFTLNQTATIDGIVVGLVGADDTMHLHLRDWMDRDIKLIVTDEVMAREMLQYFRGPTLRVSVNGLWKRTDHGWVPENNKAKVISYEKLDDAPLTDIFKKFAAVPDNGWKQLSNPEAFLADLRGEEK